MITGVNFLFDIGCLAQKIFEIITDNCACLPSRLARALWIEMRDMEMTTLAQKVEVRESFADLNMRQWFNLHDPG